MGMRYGESLDEYGAQSLGIEVASAAQAVGVALAPIAVEDNGDVAQGRYPVRRQTSVVDPQTQAQMLQRAVLEGAFPTWPVGGDLLDLQILALILTPEMARVCRGWGIGRRQDGENNSDKVGARSNCNADKRDVVVYREEGIHRDDLWLILSHKSDF
ncbi:unnamed protein product [Fusarium graminearum]|uniref:Chromosome 2, complete genome n=1 Tax=Gibberella zeae (strain ATCC MYA-4620 / CBS 123657 / FGSC 9075 / NRRL 31084 / PH-1) TaxID=229533 RepID=A0A098DE87_GIBZE|nr:unnamed protein product [Fusarium graminearum]CZS80051.1 unnamed protein product [Fusarium graminearum]